MLAGTAWLPPAGFSGETGYAGNTGAATVKAPSAPGRGRSWRPERGDLPESGGGLKLDLSQTFAGTPDAKEAPCT